eukprot:CAMPEP_0114653854 /NCGR_PEP_ID=MMETSP0191-20121206/10069_1 /TAXON_ID=126664 /ORGANISM="Sorites sp." /LENGTH=156 /DNA_ID=CAMNT_0001869103 /DNA_START=54 /DNA_END=524 /DNA_ORIENTATION=+
MAQTRILRAAFLLATLLLLVPSRHQAFFLPLAQGRGGGVARRAKGGAIMSFDNREDFEKNLNGSLTVAMFSSSMCGPCFLMEPKMEELASKYANDGLKVVKISLEPGRNAKAVKPLYSDMEVRELPTFILFKDGEQKGRISGTRLPELLDMVEGLL